MGRRKKYNSDASSSDDASMNQAWVDDNDAPEEEEVVLGDPAPAPVAEPVVAPEPAAEPEPVVAPEPVAVEEKPVVTEPAPAVEVKPATSSPAVSYRFGQYFDHPRYGRVRVVSVPRNGRFKIRIMKNRSVIDFTGN